MRPGTLTALAAVGLAVAAPVALAGQQSTTIGTGAKTCVLKPGADFRGAKLRHAEFRGANLKGARLDAPPKAGKQANGNEGQPAPPCAPKCQGADLASADLFNANLNGANLNGADLTEAEWALNSRALRDSDVQQQIDQSTDTHRKEPHDDPVQKTETRLRRVICGKKRWLHILATLPTDLEC